MKLQHPEATASAIKFLRERFVTARCDSEAVADCVRCAVLFLIGDVEPLLKEMPPLTANIHGIGPDVGDGPPPAAKCHCGLPLIPNGDDPWCSGCNMSAKVCDCRPDARSLASSVG